MADQEVIKHTKKIYKIWNSKEHSFWHKLKEFAIEVFIVVFAVSLSIWLHKKSEHAHQQNVVKEFLLGLKSDLKNDIRELDNDKLNYIESKKSFTYLKNAANDNSLDFDSIQFFRKGIFSTIQFTANDGRYEGFKSSGNIGNILNAELQNEIVNFYQEDIKTLQFTTKDYSARKEKFIDFYINNFKKIKDSTNIISIFASDVGKNYVNIFGQLDEIIGRYDICINKASKIISLIEKEYK